MESSDTDDNEIMLALTSLAENTKKAEEQVIHALNRLKLLEFKMKQELEDLSETQLKAKPALRYWLETRSLPKTSTFQEFFERFLEEHKAEHRLDLTDRSIHLNKDGCKLFGYAGKDVKVRLTEILERLPQIYH